MPLNAFIVRPFGKKELIVNSANLPILSDTYESKIKGCNESIIEYKLQNDDKTAETDFLFSVEKIVPSAEEVLSAQEIVNPKVGLKLDFWRVAVDFDIVHEHLVAPALRGLKIRGEAASAVMVAGNIREDMFHRLITADLVIADTSMHNANVFYELGIRQAFRDKYTFLIRCNLSEYPFDLKTDRYFDYDLVKLLDNDKKKEEIERLTEALRTTIMSIKADSPVFKLLPNLEAEDRSRFISVPDEFREEVERARQLRLPEYLRILAVECADTLWEIEGLRKVGRAQFESNFIDDAKVTWEQIVNRYPDDVEANTTLSTIYQRRNDVSRSDQALARASRVGTLTSNRQSHLRSLNGRNLKEAWIKKWEENGNTVEVCQRIALTSPLLQRACDAFEEAFKLDLNNAYAGLNALTLLVIQTELARDQFELWCELQASSDEIEADAELKRRNERIGQLIATLELAIESEQERLRREGTVDPWFSLLNASVACIISHQPKFVEQLYMDAMEFAPADSEQSMRRALEVYQKLGIDGLSIETKQETEKAQERLLYKTHALNINCKNGIRTVGTIKDNVEHALKVLARKDNRDERSKNPQRILMFAGSRLKLSEKIDDEPSRLAIEEIRKVIIEEQQKNGKFIFGLAAASAQGGDLLFHQVCHEKLGEPLPTRMCLALPRGDYIGRYVASAGTEWVEMFSKVYRYVDEQRNKTNSNTADQDSNENCNNCLQDTKEQNWWAINYFTDSNEMPRWLQGRPLYNVERRNNLWMLQHAIVSANSLGENTEITLITHYDRKDEHYNLSNNHSIKHYDDDQNGYDIGSISHLVKQAENAGIKVKKINLAPDQNHNAKIDNQHANNRETENIPGQETYKHSVIQAADASNEYSLRLISTATIEALMKEGRNLVIVALIGTDLHIRVFDNKGKKAIDKAEKELNRGPEITELKKWLNPIPNEPTLPKEDKQKIIRDAMLIAGYKQKN